MHRTIAPSHKALANSSSIRPAALTPEAADCPDTAPVAVTEKRLQRYKTTLDLSLRRFFRKQGLAPGAISYRVRALWKEVLDGSLYENDLTQALLHTVRKDPEVTILIRDHISRILGTSDSESERECEEPTSSTQKPRVAKRLRD